VVMSRPESGLGVNLLSTAGDEDPNIELPSRHFIGEILPEGAVANSGVFQVGDELLAVSFHWFLHHFYNSLNFIVMKLKQFSLIFV